MYPIVAGSKYGVRWKNKYLKTLTRLNCGVQSTDATIRYPEDSFDRLWSPPEGEISIKTASTTSSMTVTSPDKPPMGVMQSAWVDEKSFQWFIPISGYELSKTSSFFFMLFFVEVEAVGLSSARVMQVLLNSDTFISDLKIDGNPTDLYPVDPAILTADGATFTFGTSPGSSLGPLLNAAEFSALRHFNTYATYWEELEALDDFKVNLGLTSWIGDPCLPVPYTWLTCIGGDTSAARISTINLSGLNLVGSISPKLRLMPFLSELRLENNKILCKIPNLSNLKNLRIIHLQNNSLSGGIPSTLATLPLLTEL
ncbi:hypothetical protein R1flu_016594 [Riccia fluitans]|uniref:Malectin-like domain-containing protein n=1 Tax=Riccia fluitans TaxID=41844 RepID=A0ABD1YMA2_9MARC